jgi:MoxR-like ATPase
VTARTDTVDGSDTDASGGGEPVAAGVARFRADMDRLLAEVGRRLVGMHQTLDGVLTAVLAGGHALLEGVPGVGKTLLVRALGEALDLSFTRIQFTPDLMPSDVTGTYILVESDGGGGGRRLEFQRGPIFSNLVLADEINRATPKTQSALLEAMQEQGVTIGKVTHPLPAPFFVLATQNPIEMEGTYPLPEAQLDRFFFKLRVPYPARDEVHAILDRTTGAAEPPVRPVLGPQRLMELRALVRRVPIARPIQDYAVRLVEATHPRAKSGAGGGGGAAAAVAVLPAVDRFVRYGSSPRGAQALVLAAKISALRQGRLTPSFEDVRQAAVPALAHRVLLSFEGEAEGTRTEDLVRAIVAAIPEETPR